MGALGHGGPPARLDPSLPSLLPEVAGTIVAVDPSMMESSCPLEVDQNQEVASAVRHPP